MRWQWKILLATGGLILAGTGIVSTTANRAQMEAERTLGAMRREGFKLEVSQFDHGTAPQLRARAATLREASSAYLAWPTLSLARWIAPVGTNAAVALWQQ